MLVLVIVFFAFAAQSVMAGEVIRFSWWGADSRHKPTNDALRLFEAKNPGVIVKGEYMGFSGYSERLTTQISGGTEPDVMQLNWAWVSAQYSKKGDKFYDLYKAKDVINLSAFGNALKVCEINGKLNSIPVSYTARFFLWQKSTFDKAGLSLPKTWDDLFALGKAFETKLGKDYYPLDGVSYDVINIAQTYMIQKTGKFWIDPKTPKVAFTDAETLEFIKIYKKLSETRAVVPLQARLSVAPPDTPVEQVNEWYSGQWAGLYIWDSTFRARIKPLPATKSVVVGDFITMKGAKKSGFFARPSMVFAVSKNSKKPLLAAKLIDFLLNNPEAIMVLGASRGAPMSNIGYDILVKENKFITAEKDAINQLRKVAVDAPSPYFEHAKIQEHMRATFEKVSMGTISDADAVKLLTVETNKILKSIND